MGRIVISCYRPKPGKAAKLEDLTKSHMDRLRAEGLVSDRIPVVMKAKDGTIVEVFEWKSKEAIDQAHANPNVQKMWEEYAEVCDFVKPEEVAEFSQLFSEFEPIN